MKNNWVLVAIIAAVLAVPFVLALRDDTTDETQATRTDKSDDSEVTAPVTADAGSAPTDEPAWEVNAVADRRFYDAVFLAGEGSTHPALVGVLGGLQLGMTRDEAALAAPAAADWQTTGALADFPGARLWLRFKAAGNTLSTVRVSFPDKGSAISILTNAWGEPTHAATLADGPIALWLDPERSMRALVTQWSATAQSGVAIAAYTPVAELIAPKRKLFGFETRKLLGSTKDTVLKAYADRIVADSRQQFQIPLGFTEYASEPQQAVLHIENDRVDKVEIPIDYRLEPGSYRAIFELLEQKFGKPTETEPGGRETVFARGSERITVERRADATVLFVRIEPR